MSLAEIKGYRCGNSAFLRESEERACSEKKLRLYPALVGSILVFLVGFSRVSGSRPIASKVGDSVALFHTIEAGDITWFQAAAQF